MGAQDETVCLSRFCGPCCRCMTATETDHRSFEEEEEAIGSAWDQWRRPVKVTFFFLALAIAVYLLLPQMGTLTETREALTQANGWWLLAAAVFCVATYIAAAMAQASATDVFLPFWENVGVHVAAGVAAWLTPGNVGGLGLNVRYHQKRGASRPQAVAGVGLQTAAAFVTHLVMLVVAVLLMVRLGLGSGPRFERPKAMPILVGVIILSLIIAVAVSTRTGRRLVIRPARQGFRSLIEVLRQPWKAIRLFGASFLLTFSYICALWCCVRAFDGNTNLIAVSAAYLGATALANAAPTPGGLGAVETALVASLTAVGTARATDIVFAVLAFRCITFWIPLLPGWILFTVLYRRGIF